MKYLQTNGDFEEKVFLGKDDLFKMELNSQKVGEILIINLHKSIFHRPYVDDLRNFVINLIGENEKNIFLDLSQIDYIDGVGLGVLFTIHKTAIYHDVNIRLFGLQPHIKQMFTQTRISKVLDICKPEEESLLKKQIVKQAQVAYRIA